MVDQGYGAERYPSAPPERPRVDVAASPLEMVVQPRPRSVDISYWLWLAACLLGVATAAATLLSFDQLQADMLAVVEREFPDELPETRDQVATAAVAVLVGTGVLVVLVELALALAMHSGRGWARFGLILVALFGACYGLVVFGVAPQVTQVGLAVVGVVTLLAVVLMFLPGTGGWFAARRLARSGGYESGE